MDDETRQLSRDLAALTNNVTRIATIVESSEKRHDEAMHAIKDLSEKVSANGSLKDDMSSMREDLRVLRHDMNQMSNGLNGISLLGEKLTEHKADTAEKISDLKTSVAAIGVRIKSVEDRNTRIDGGVKVVEKISGWVWAAVGGLAMLVASNWSAVRAVLSKGVIGGE